MSKVDQNIWEGNLNKQDAENINVSKSQQTTAFDIDFKRILCLRLRPCF